MPNGTPRHFLATTERNGLVSDAYDAYKRFVCGLEKGRL
jgi:hypothetical protein